ncbi:MAG: permease [Deltaproteobacteria bacterium]|nr:permease [Deltaproteobacteria bacterium]
MLWPLLAMSIAGLLLGPVLVAMGRGRRSASAAIEGLTIGVVPVLVITRLLPHTMEELRAGALALAALGFLAVSFAHRGGHALEARIGRAVVVPTLLLHAITDGAGLAISAAAPERSAGWVLGAALILHRLPEGLFVATALAPPGVESSPRRTYVPVALLAIGTIIGALGGVRILSAVPETIVDGVVAFGIGAMLRLVVHTHTPAPDAAQRAVSAVSFLVGVALVLSLPDPLGVLQRAQPSELSLVQSVVPLFVETAPSFLAALVVTGVLYAVVPRRRASWLEATRPVAQAARGAAFGVPLPAGSCGVLPIARRLFALHIPVAAILAFVVATPALALDGAFLSVRLLGAPLTLARLAVSVILAMVVALAIGRFARPSASIASFGAPDVGAQAEASFGHADTAPSAWARMRDGFVDALDHLGAWYVLGILGAAAFEATIDPALSRMVPRPLDVVATVLLSIPLWVSTVGATPLAAMMIHKGFSTTAALALLVVGPATNLTMLAVLRQEIGGRAVAAYVIAVAVLGAAAAFLVARVVPASSIPAMHPLVAHRHLAVEWASLLVLAGLFAWSLLRMGPRGWLAAMIVESHEEHARDHGCAHEHHGHEHGAST